MRLLDTDTLSHFFDGNPRVLQRLATVADDVGTTVVNRIELLQVRFRHVLTAGDGRQLLVAQEWLARTVALLEQFSAVPFDEQAADHFDRLRAMRRLRKIGRPDLLIASIALANDTILVTRNVRDFALIPGLVVEDWCE